MNHCYSIAVLFCWIGSIASGAEPNAAGWIKSSRNPILSLGGRNDFDGWNIFSPNLTKDGGKYYLFYSGGPRDPAGFVKYQIGLATSTDGEIWTKTGAPLLPLGERDDFHATPSLLRNSTGDLMKIDDVWHMVYCGNRADDIEHATSRDGMKWEKDPRSPIYKAAYSPNLVHTGNELRMYYISKPVGKKWEVHLATGPDLYSLSPHAENPVLTLSQPWEVGALFYPYVLKEGDTWVMFYAAYWTQHPTTKSATAIGMATSNDGIHWTKFESNPVLKPDPASPFDSTYNSSQSVIRDGQLWRLAYAGRIDHRHKYFAIGMATNAGPLLPTPRSKSSR